MRRTTVLLPDDVDARLRHEATRRGTSLGALIREALTERFPAVPLTFVGTFGDDERPIPPSDDELFDALNDEYEADQRAFAAGRHAVGDRAG
ncbi:MAG: CopG family transcriptional regulator [Acidimicrobiia bacterium]|jgi:hypothetical protein|nr:CopG family transcriptional regulator [Acidimicrobiia bacterium]